MSRTNKKNRNPHQLTMNQHCFPKKSIDRFANDDGYVEVYLMQQSKKIIKRPSDKHFCAQRVWDQPSESGFMKNIEDDYQKLVDQLISENADSISDMNHLTITKMYSLWEARSHWRNQHLDDTEIQGVRRPTIEISQDDCDLLEKNGITSMRSNSSIPGVHLTGLMLVMHVEQLVQVYRSWHWNILRSQTGDFLVPDKPSPLPSRFLPVNPNTCFSLARSRIISEAELAQINTHLAKFSDKYYFSRSLSRCIFESSV